MNLLKLKNEKVDFFHHERKDDSEIEMKIEAFKREREREKGHVLHEKKK
jgi:hypothetical protein